MSLSDTAISTEGLIRTVDTVMYSTDVVMDTLLPTRDRRMCSPECSCCRGRLLREECERRVTQLLLAIFGE